MNNSQLQRNVPGWGVPHCLYNEPRSLREPVSSSQTDIISFLSEPKTYGETEPVRVHQTHGSMVFLSGPSAYKLKRAVKFPYMDYSTSALRKAMCMRELETNKRMAPQLYKEVRGIVAGPDGVHFVSPDDPRSIDWVVVMRRFSQDDLLEERRKKVGLALEDMVAVGETIASFHQGALRVSSSGGVSGIRAVVAENVALLAELPASFPEDLVTRYSDLSEIWLRRLRPVLGARRRSGMVRRCHGDLHLNNVCFIDGCPVLFDAIEFNDSFSCIDVGYDLAFILMDLDSNGLRSHANALLNRYLERSCDYGMLGCLPLFMSCRAAIRAHIAVAAERAGAEVTQGRARRLLELAIAYLTPSSPKLVAIGGLSGSGKTTVARGLAPDLGPAPGAIVLRSDVIRKAMFDVPETEKLSQDAYVPAVTAEVYTRLRARALQISQFGYGVIADATFSNDVERHLLEDAARAANVSFTGLWLDASPATLERRIVCRKSDASDADISVLARQIAATSPPTDWKKVDANGLPTEVVGRARDLAGAVR